MPPTSAPRDGGQPKRETRSARFEFLIRPSLKARAQAVAVAGNQSLSDYAHDTLEAAIERAERQAKRQA